MMVASAILSETADALAVGGEEVLKMRQERIKAMEALQELRQSSVFVLWTKQDLEFQDFFILADMLEEEDPSQAIDLIILSHGGSGDAGYRIGHTFQKWAARKGVAFRVIVPLYAKSAATVLSLGADEIVMGLQSEIGPIDPQIRRYDRSRGRWTYVPAMATMDGLKLASEYLQKIPAMSGVFEEIVRNANLSLVELGMLERMRDTSKQYAEALLSGGMKLGEDQAHNIAERLTDHYKYHGHPIDCFEAEQDCKLKVRYSDGEEWRAIKAVRGKFEGFVGPPDIIPGIVVITAIETIHLTHWRRVSSQGQEQQAVSQTPMLEL